MHIKTIRRDDWTCMTDKEFIIRDFAWDGISGKIALIRIRQVSAPFVIDYGTDEVTIADAGYSWVQIALEGQFFWITSMFDEANRLVEIYIDMTDGNVTDVEEPYFEDLYLDYVVHVQADTVMELDRAELTAAYEAGTITSEQYERTLREGERVCQYLLQNRRDLEALLIRQQRTLGK